jgi:hypothetical protein
MDRAPGSWLGCPSEVQSTIQAADHDGGPSYFEVPGSRPLPCNPILSHTDLAARDSESPGTRPSGTALRAAAPQAVDQ